MSKLNKVLVVGGGIGGLSAAISLRNNDIEVDLVEKTKEFTVYHVGIIVQANVIRAMQELGIADEAIAAGFPYEMVVLHDVNGNVLTKIPGEKLAGQNYPSNLGMARPALHKVLINGAKDRDANIKLGVTYKDIVQHEDHVSVSFTDDTNNEYDVIIGADGVFSDVRKTVFGEQFKPVFSGQGVWRYNLPRPPEVDNVHMFDGRDGGKAGLVPLTESTMYILAVYREPGNPHIPEEELATRFRQKLAPYGGLIADCRDQITESSMVVYRPLNTILMPDPWYKQRVILIGDAAHATTPHLGQGAAQAIEDAVVIGNVFSEKLPLEEGLKKFMSLRYERCKFIYESSIQLGKWEQDQTPDADWPGLSRKSHRYVSAPLM